MTAAQPRPPTADGRLLRLEPAARRWLAVSVGTGLLAAVAVVVAAFATAVVIADIFPGQGALAGNAPLLALVAVLAAARSVLVIVQEVAAARASTRLRARVRRQLADQLIALGPAYVAAHGRGRLGGALTDAIDALDAWMTSYQPARLLAIGVPAIVLAVVFVIDPLTALVLVLTGPVLILLLAVVGGRARAVSDRRSRELRWLSGFFLDILRGIASLKAFGRSVEQAETLRDISRRYGETTMEVLRTAFQTSLVLEWGAAIAMAIVAVEVGLRLVDGGMTFERALAVLIITPESFLPLRQLATRYHAGAAGRLAAEEIVAVLDAPVARGSGIVMGGSAEPQGRPKARAAPVADPSVADVRFEMVSYRHEGRVVPTIDDLDLTIPAGRRLALVGPTGAGKSTIVGLLLRMLEPTSGRILLGEIPLSSVTPRDWRRVIAWVPQSPHLFHGSIADNLRLGRPEASESELHRALHAAGLDDLLERSPDGLQAAVGEGGTRLSGGQRQRLALARAFLRDAPLVVLDEPTAHLDHAQEVAIDSAITRLTVGRTVLVISHRLRLARSADIVAVLEAGRVVENGRPTDLLAAGGAFARLVATEATTRPWGEPAPDAGATDGWNDAPWPDLGEGVAG